MPTEQIKELREKGWTLARIADHFGRSINWVYSRVNQNYAVSRNNVTLKDELIDEPENEVQQLRKQGLTYNQISRITGKSRYWVATQLGRGYTGQNSNKEGQFRDDYVVPFLKDAGHHSIITEFKSGPQRADIISTLDKQIYMTEVKINLIGHQLQRAIGQCVLHQIENPSFKLLIAIPDHFTISQDITAGLSILYKIDILFVPYLEKEPVDQAD